ncbi:unnamed protein product [Rotaria sp. Silwood1]|nr:unnamed protein product [Rotaria sp. Silwood1]CAF3717755.1 unnamed protein product [Rotaria sp. Silwood1]CAF4879257.1 unnamed protein product [Rotaria sp. Silwood1]CAF4977602.1 unnamed protein product [Rotaria sp. Silwood1]
MNSITKFEQLPNELILMCFSYFDFYYLYEIFYCLNQRFNQLIQYQTKIHIDLSLIPSRKFLTFCFQLKQLITTSQNYPLSIIAYDQQKLNLILEDDLFQETFSKLKSLTLSNIDTKTIYSIIFDKPVKLYQSLERFSLLYEISREDERSDDIERLCSNLISSKMKSLKYLKINFIPYSTVCEYDWYTRSDYVYLEFVELEKREKSLSHLETLIIENISDDDYYTKTTICFHVLIEYLLPCLPKLKNLIINSIHFEDYEWRQQDKASSTTTTNSILPLNLKIIQVCINSDNNNQDDMEKYTNVVRNFFINNTLSDVTTIKIFKINNENVL